MPNINAKERLWRPVLVVNESMNFHCNVSSYVTLLVILVEFVISMQPYVLTQNRQNKTTNQLEIYRTAFQRKAVSVYLTPIRFGADAWLSPYVSKFHFSGAIVHSSEDFRYLRPPFDCLQCFCPLIAQTCIRQILTMLRGVKLSFSLTIPFI